MKTLEDLWFNGIPDNKHGAATNKSCRELCELIERNERELIPLLSNEAKEVFEKLKDNLEELSQICECEIFVQGFRLGAGIMLDVLDRDDDEILTG